MGPRSEERGELAFSAPTSRPASLQWGRAPRSAERSRVRAQKPQPTYASMGPRSEERGELKATLLPPSDGYASMGPRSEERGERLPSRSIVSVTKASMGPRSEERGEADLKAMG